MIQIVQFKKHMSPAKRLLLVKFDLIFLMPAQLQFTYSSHKTLASLLSLINVTYDWLTYATYKHSYVIQTEI